MKSVCIGGTESVGGNTDNLGFTLALHTIEWIMKRPQRTLRLILALLLPHDVVPVWMLLADELGVDHGKDEGRRVDGVCGVVAPVGAKLFCTEFEP